MELIIGFLLAVLGIIAAAVSRQLADEFKAWTPWVTKLLIRRAVRKLPDEQKDRYEEEWLSHVNEIPGEVGKLVAAFGLFPATRRMSARGTALKYAFDILASTFCLISCVPTFLIIAVLIKLEDGGPVLVTESRRGLNGRTILVLKFRTADLGTPTQPTRVGSRLHMLKLDALPGLINILRGDLPFPQWIDMVRALIQSD
jgi:hypothetical protein